MSASQRPWLAAYPESLRHRPTGDPTDVLTAFRATVAQYAKRPAVHYLGSTTTWRELDTQSDALAAALADLDVGRGDRVAVYLQNLPSFLVGVLAIWKVGGAVVPVNPMNRQRELTLQLGDSGARVVICLRSGHPTVADVLGDRTDVAVITVDDHHGAARGDDRVLPPALPASPTSTLDYADLLARYGNRRPERIDLRSSDIAFLTYTSGTTGPPKAAVNTHGQVMWATALAGPGRDDLG